jgi:hypothetical protein
MAEWLRVPRLPKKLPRGSDMSLRSQRKRNMWKLLAATSNCGRQ